MKLFSIPNLLTLCNLLCGCVAIVFAFEGNLVWSTYLVGIACVFDFLDGFVARALKMHSPIGKDLDSLADMVTFGVVPGVVMFQIMSNKLGILELHDLSNYNPWSYSEDATVENYGLYMKYLPYAAFLLTIFSALRLAKFNNDPRQTDSFIGLPTPANTIFFTSLVLILNHPAETVPERNMNSLIFERIVTTSRSPATALDELIMNPYFFLGSIMVMSFLLISEIPLFALKFKNFGWKGNEIRYVFLVLSVVMIALLKFIALPLVIVLYILMSVINNLVAGK